PLGGVDRAGRAGGRRAHRRERRGGADRDRRRQRDRGAGGRVPDRRAAHGERARHPSAGASAAGGEAPRSRSGRAPRRLRGRLHAAPGAVDPRLDARRDGPPHRAAHPLRSARIPFVMASSATMFSEGKSAILDRVLDPNQPDFTYIALLFDGPYALAAALNDGELTQRQYRDDRVGDPGLRALYDKVQMVPDL